MAETPSKSPMTPRYVTGSELRYAEEKRNEGLAGEDRGGETDGGS